MVMPAPRLGSDEPPDVHGGADATELTRLGLRADQVIDFSANLNPYGPSPAALRAIESVAVDRYPDRACCGLRDELARRHDVGQEQVLLGNGSSELIWLTAIAFLAAGDGALVLGPSFSGYERSARLMGARIFTVQATAEDGFRPPLDAFAIEILQRQPKLAFLANPNNPTGQAVGLDEVFHIASRHRQTLFVLDEAYGDCQVSAAPHRPGSPANVLRLRSMTKAHGLAGLRLGYAVGAAQVIDALRRAQPPWSVNGMAQAAGVAALRDEAHRRDSVARWLDASAGLVDRIQKANFVSLPSVVPFFLLKVGDARQARSVLLRRRMLVRDCTSFGLPKHIRICARQPEENGQLLQALVAARSEIEP